MNKISKKREEELLQLAEDVAVKPMTRDEMATHIGLEYRNFSKYITWLLANKLVYICDWRIQKSRYIAVYTKGNLPHAPKKKLGMAECNRRHRERERERLAFARGEFVVRPDPAAAWLFNPIEVAA